jgi:hypothetical protein
MSKKVIKGFGGSKTGWYYVCETWKQCRAYNGMWKAIREELWVTEPGQWECSCGKPDNIRIHIDDVKRQLAA